MRLAYPLSWCMVVCRSRRSVGPIVSPGECSAFILSLCLWVLSANIHYYSNGKNPFFSAGHCMGMIARGNHPACTIGKHPLICSLRLNLIFSSRLLLRFFCKCESEGPPLLLHISFGRAIFVKKNSASFFPCILRPSYLKSRLFYPLTQVSSYPQRKEGKTKRKRKFFSTPFFPRIEEICSSAQTHTDISIPQDE